MHGPLSRVASGLMLLVPLVLQPAAAQSATYYVRPDGNNGHSGRGDSAREAWATIDRGQPTQLREAIAPGQTEIKLARAIQFPKSGSVRIGTAVVSYADRTPDRLRGCRGTPAARAGAVVASVDWSAPGSGDMVLVSGLYGASSDWPPATPGLDTSTVTISSGGASGRPVVFRGLGRALVDGRDVATAVRIDASHLVWEGFEIRRGGIRIDRAGHVAVRHCRVHEGRMGIAALYATHLEITGNKVFDLHGAWTGDPIQLHQCTDAQVRQNTIVACGRPAITVSGSRSAPAAIRENLLAWCRTGLNATEGARLSSDLVGGNCLWKMGRVTWLHKPDEGSEYYRGLDFEPADLHADPKIISWRSGDPAFLEIALDSPCATGGRRMGAGRATAYPPAAIAENLVPNPGFESGRYGWHGATWQPSRPEWASWDVVREHKTSSNHCLRLVYSPVQGKDVQLRVVGLHVPVKRGIPLRLSFRARGERPGGGRPTLHAGVAVPSWHSGSAILKPFSLSGDWTEYRNDIELPAFYPNDVAVQFSPRSSGTFWIDDVRLEHGAQANPSRLGADLALHEPPPGMRLAPGDPLKLRLIAHGLATRTVDVHWQWKTPLGRPSAVERKSIGVDATQSVPLAIPVPPELRGAVAFAYTVEGNQGPLARGEYRLLVAEPARHGRNSAFFAATPNWSGWFRDQRWTWQCRALAELGIGTFHEYMGLDRMREVVEDPLWQFGVDTARAAGIQWLWTVDDSPLFTGKRAFAPAPGNVEDQPLVAPKHSVADGRLTPVQMQSWSEWVTALARKFRGRVKYWEVLNEPNCYLSGEEYLRVLEPTSTILRREVPQAVIIGGSVVNAPRKDLYNKAIFDGHRWFDLFSYHPYRFGLANPESEAESYRRDLQMAKGDLARAGSRARIFLTEEGMGPGFEETRPIGGYLSHAYPINAAAWGEGEIRQAQFLARMYVTALGERCAGYNYHVLPSLLNDELMTPKLALVAIHAMTCLADAEPLGRVDLGPDYVGYLFQLPTRVTAAIWAKDAEYAAPIAVALDGVKKAEVVNLFGNPTPVEAETGGRLRFSLGRELIYLHLPGASADHGRRVLQNTFRPLRSIPAL